MNFYDRIKQLPFLGIGVSTEYGASQAQGALDVFALAQEAPEFAGFLEVGVEVTKGLDETAMAWADENRPTTYHFLDVNLDDPTDFDDAWLNSVKVMTERLKPAWMCGDAGLWHFGCRDRGHMLLLPPILTDDVARAMGHGIAMLRAHTGLEVFPENPPGDVFLGDLHLLDFFARVCEYGDTGMLLDVAHLAIYQRAMGHQPTDGLDHLPHERVMEIHVAGAREVEVDGLSVILDDHTPNILPDTWSILDAVVPCAQNLRALVFECERNSLETCLGGFQELKTHLLGTPFAPQDAP